jgi:SAM-dependent methyltransferase
MLKRAQEALRFIGKEVMETLRRPRRVGRVFDARAWRGVRYRFGRRAREWKSDHGGQFQHKLYRSYEDYVEHQRSKLELLDLDDYHRRFRSELRTRLEGLSLDLRGKSVLCLAARTGAEVLSFRDLGAFAVGIDLLPGNSQLVLTGDFHAIQFADSSADVVFTNSLDHSFDLSRVASEIRRVTKAGGLAVLELMLGTSETKREFGDWEAISWETRKAALQVFEQLGFTSISTTQFSYPWDGVTAVLKLKE